MKKNLIIAGASAMALTLAACGGNDAEETTGMDTMTTEDPMMDGTMPADGAMTGPDGTMSGDTGAAGSMNGAAGGTAAGVGAGAARTGMDGSAATGGTTTGGATGTNVPGPADDRVGSRPAGDANEPTPQ